MLYRGALLCLSLMVVTRLNAAEVPAARESVAPATKKARGFTEPYTGMGFVNVPGGCFTMGDTHGDGQGDEKPLHQVCLDSFSLGKHEVTNAQFRKFRPDHDSGIYEGNSLNGGNQPVTNVSWYDAAEFAKWLTAKTGRVFRLPTEAEWEYAARGGTGGRNYWGEDTAVACRNANGADLTAKAQWPEWTTTDCNDGYKVSSPAGSFQPNAYGLFDMMGNAWEWTNDWYDAWYYFDSPRNNPQGPSGGKLKIPRGGGWGNASECVRVADRNGFDPEFTILFLGFRLASSAEQIVPQ
jgi:formylglycine-generating enzyme required for sulfatase activity